MAAGPTRLLTVVNYRARGSETYAPRMRRRLRVRGTEVCQVHADPLPDSNAQNCKT